MDDLTQTLALTLALTLGAERTGGIGDEYAVGHSREDAVDTGIDAPASRHARTGMSERT